MNNTKDRYTSKHAHLFIPLLMMIIIGLSGCNLPAMNSPEPAAALPSGQQTMPAETAVQPTVETLPLATLSASPAAQETAAAASPAVFSTSGPWVILPAQDRLWAANLDGSFSMPLVNQAGIEWYVQEAAAAPQGGYVAFTASLEANKRSHLTLFIVKVPEMDSVFTLELTPSDEIAPENAGVCDPTFESLQALTMNGGLSWSPDGKSLAFIGAQTGASADLYVYSLESGAVTQAADVPSNAFNPTWSPDGQNIVFFTADCFGEGNGISVKGAWSAKSDGSNFEELYGTPVDGAGEKVLGWHGSRDVIVATQTDCPVINIRSINLDSRAMTLLFDRCYEDAVMSDDGSIAVIAGPEVAGADLDGLFILPSDGTAAYYNPDVAGHRITWSSNRKSYLIIDTDNKAVEIGTDAQPKTGMNLSELPVFSSNGEWWAAAAGNDLVMGSSPTSGDVVFSGVISSLLWITDPATGIERLFFLGGGSSDDMQFYRVEPPDLAAVPVNGISVMGGAGKIRLLNP